MPASKSTRTSTSAEAGVRATYVYCLVAAARKPSTGSLPPGLPGAGPVRLLDVADRRWLAVADAPLDRYGEAAINSRLSDLDWVGRAALGHESVVEAFRSAAVVPMKLFTLFASDERALEHIRGVRPHIEAIVDRIAGKQEWGVRVMLTGAPPKATPRPGRRAAARASGAGYLAAKKTLRDETAARSARSRARASQLFSRLEAAATAARRREASDDAPGVLLDAAFLVPAGRAARFRRVAAAAERALRADGCRLALSGPWPPYSFVAE